MSFDGIKQDIANSYAFFSKVESERSKDSIQQSDLAQTLDLLINCYDENHVDKFLQDKTSDILNELRDLIGVEYKKNELPEATQKLLANLYAKILKVKVEKASLQKAGLSSIEQPQLTRKILVQEGVKKLPQNLTDTLKNFAFSIWLSNFIQQYASLDETQKNELLDDLSDEQIQFFQTGLEKIDPLSDLNNKLIEIKTDRLKAKLSLDSARIDISDKGRTITHEEPSKDQERIFNAAFSEHPKHLISTKSSLSVADNKTQSLAYRIFSQIAKFFIKFSNAITGTFYRLFSSKLMVSTDPNISKVASKAIKRNAELDRKVRFEAMCQNGRKVLEKSLGLTPQADESTQSAQKQFKNLLGFSLSSTVKNYSEGSSTPLDTILSDSSLRQDVEELIEKENKAEQFSDIRKNTVFFDPGSGAASSYFEKKNLDAILEDTELQRKIRLDEADKKKLQEYQEALIRSEDLNLGLSSLRADKGHLAKINSDSEEMKPLRDSISLIERNIKTLSSSLRRKEEKAFINILDRYMHKLKADFDPMDQTSLIDLYANLESKFSESFTLELKELFQNVRGVHETLREDIERTEGNLSVFMNELKEHIGSLEDSKSLYLDISIEFHLMRLAIKKVGNELVMTVYDSSGALDRLNRSYLELYFLNRFNKNCLTSNGFQITCSLSDFEASGIERLKETLFLGTSQGMQAQKSRKPIIESSFLGRCSSAWGKKILYRQNVYQNFFESFKNISKDRRGVFLDVQQKPQVTNNCFAAKSITNQYYELGIGLFKKFRAAELFMNQLEIRNKIVGKINPEGGLEGSLFTNTEYRQRFLTQVAGVSSLKAKKSYHIGLSGIKTYDELKKISSRLVQLSQIPSREYFVSYLSQLNQLKETLNKVYLDSNDTTKKQNYLRAYLEIDSHLKSLEKTFREDLVQSFQREKLSYFNKEGSLKLDNVEALNEFCEFLTFKSLEGIYELSNHNLNRLALERRYLTNLSQRCPLVDPKGKNIQLRDIENARIVSYAEDVISGIIKRKVSAIEIMIEGVYVEITPKDFFFLVKANSQALESKEITEIVQFLRGESEDMRKLYDQELFEAHRKKMYDKTLENVTRLTDQLEEQNEKLNLEIEAIKQARSGIEAKRKEIDARLASISIKDSSKTSEEYKAYKLYDEQLKFSLSNYDSLLIELEVYQKSLQEQLDFFQDEIGVESSLAPLVILRKMRSAKADEFAEISSKYIVLSEELSARNIYFQESLKLIREIKNEFTLSFKDSLDKELDQSLTLALRKTDTFNLLFSLSQLGGVDKLHAKSELSQSIKKIHSNYLEESKEIFKEQLEISIDKKALSDLPHYLSYSQSFLESLSPESLASISASLDPEPLVIDSKKRLIDFFKKSIAPEILLNILNSGDEQEVQIEQINKLFKKWIQDRTRIDIPSFTNAHMSLEITPDEFRSIAISIEDFEKDLKVRNDAAKKLGVLFRARAKKSEILPKESLKVALERQDLTDLTFLTLDQVQRPFLEAKAYEGGIDSKESNGTIDQLFVNPNPLCFSKEHFIEDSIVYLNYLKEHPEIDGQKEKIISHISGLVTLFLNNPTAISIEQKKWFLDFSKDLFGAYEKSFESLGNDARKELLSFFSLTYLLEAVDFDKMTLVATRSCHSKLMQIKNIINYKPLNDFLSLLTFEERNDKALSFWENKFDEIGTLLRHSSIGLDFVQEGKVALSEAIENASLESARFIADKYDITCGKSLSAQEFISFYSSMSPMSPDCLGSTTGRKRFEMLFTSIIEGQNEENKAKLITFLSQLTAKEDDGVMVKPLKVFLSELILKNEQLLSFHSDFIEYSKKTASQYYKKGLLNENPTAQFSTLISRAALIASRYEQNPTKELLFEYIAVNTAYKMMYDEMPEDVKESLSLNLEITALLSNAKSLHVKMQPAIYGLELSKENRQLLKATIQNLIEAQILESDFALLTEDGAQINGSMLVKNALVWDLDQGALYINGVKKSRLPRDIEENVDVKFLNIDRLTFKKVSGDFINFSQGKPQIVLKKLGDDLLIFRDLEVEEGVNKSLKFLGSASIAQIPSICLSEFDVETVWQDEEGTIYGFDKDYKIKVSLTKTETGEILLKSPQDGQEYLIRSLEELQRDDSLSSLLKAIDYQSLLFNKEKNQLFIPSLKINLFKEGLNWVVTSSEFKGRILDNDTKTASIILKPSAETSSKGEKLRKEIETLNSIIDSKMGKKGLKDRHELLQALQEKEEKVKMLEQFQAPCLLALPENQSHLKDIEAYTRAIHETSLEQKVLYKTLLENPGNATSIENYNRSLNRFKELIARYSNHLHETTPTVIYRIEQDVKIVPTSLSAALVQAAKGYDSFDNLREVLRNVSYPLSWQDLKFAREYIDKRLNEDPTSIEHDQFLILLMLVEMRSHVEARRVLLVTDAKISSFDAKRLKFLTDSLESKSAHIFKENVDSYSSVFIREYASAIATEFSSAIQSLYFKKSLKSHTLSLSEISLDLSAAKFYPLELTSATSYLTHTSKLTSAPPEPTQEELIARIDAISPDSQLAKESVEEQKRGFYLEEYGLFDLKAFCKLFSIKQSATSGNKEGIDHLDQGEVKALFEWMEQKGWIKKSSIDGFYEQVNHPKDSFSLVDVQSYLKSRRFNDKESLSISSLTQLWFYKLASQQFVYDIKLEQRESLAKEVSGQIEQNQWSFLEAKASLEKLFGIELITSQLADIQAAYLQDDEKVYAQLFASFGIENNAANQKTLQNALTRFLYHKAEVDHFKDIQLELNAGNWSRASSLLLTKRGFDVSQLILDPSKVNLRDGKVIEEHKIVKAFLIFEASFGHRCNLAQAKIFRGLILSDKTSPEKINAAQARMGFGKTSLMPLIALARADGKKLVRFIVPKSALESNAEEMSRVLTSSFGSKAVIDTFSRYKKNEAQSQEEFLDLVQKDLQIRLSRYEEVKESCKVLIQTPSVRNSIEDQLKIFLDMYHQMPQSKEKEKLFSCIHLLSKIRLFETLSIFDELDATQDPLTTDVNYTSGNKLKISSDHVTALKGILTYVLAHKEASKEDLVKYFVKKQASEIDGGMTEEEIQEVALYIATKNHDISDQLLHKLNENELFLLRGIFSNDSMVELVKDKQPGVDFGVWFENAEGGRKIFDKSGDDDLLIAVPYGAANEPKPKGSRFDNTEVTFIATFKYLLSSATEIQEVPHINFLINYLRDNLSLEVLSTQERKSEIIVQLQTIAHIEDPAALAQAKREFVASFSDRFDELRVPLATLIAARQITFDTSKASSNRNEQGTLNDEIIGFSGTSGDTSSFFTNVELDPSADAKVTFGIMGRSNCQKVEVLEIDEGLSSTLYSRQVIEKSLPLDQVKANRVFIDAGGYCKNSNRQIAEEVLKHYERMGCDLEGVVYYDDATNLKSVLIRQKPDGFIKMNFDRELQKKVASPDSNFITYYDQSHSRGADITQPNNCNAVISLGIGTSLSDFKQAILRMRKIVDASSGQTFSIVTDAAISNKIRAESALETSHITTNDAALWLRKKELAVNVEQKIGILINETKSVIKNFVLESVEKLIVSVESVTENREEINEELSRIIELLDQSFPLLDVSTDDLSHKYGGVAHEVIKKSFLENLQAFSKQQLLTVSDTCRGFAVKYNLSSALEFSDDESIKKRSDLIDQVIAKREKEIPETFFTPIQSATLATAEVVAEVSSQVSSESQSQSQSQSISHTFSEVQNEDIVENLYVELLDKEYSKPNLDFLSNRGALQQAHAKSSFSDLFMNEGNVQISPFFASIVRPTLQFALYDKASEKFILINRDEAALFKDSESLYQDIVLINFRDLENLATLSSDIKGHSSFKKILFTNLRGPDVDPSDIQDIKQKLEGICTFEDLAPMLKYEHEGNFAGGILDFKAWGLASEVENTIASSIKEAQDKLTIDFQGNAKPIHLEISTNIKEKVAAFITSNEIEQRVEPSQSIFDAFATKQASDLEVLKEEKKEVALEIKRNNLEKTRRLSEVKIQSKAAIRSIDSRKEQFRKRLNNEFRKDVQYRILNKGDVDVSSIDPKRLEEVRELKDKPVYNLLSTSIRSFLLQKGVIKKADNLENEALYEALWEYSGKNQGVFLNNIRTIKSDSILPLFPQEAAEEKHRGKTFRELIKQALRPHYEDKSYRIGKAKVYQEFGGSINLENIGTRWGHFFDSSFNSIADLINKSLSSVDTKLSDEKIDHVLNDFENAQIDRVASFEHVSHLEEGIAAVTKKLSGVQLVIDSTYSEVETDFEKIITEFIFEKQKEALPSINYREEIALDQISDEQRTAIEELQQFYKEIDEQYIKGMDLSTTKTEPFVDDFLLKNRHIIAKFKINMDYIYQGLSLLKKPFSEDLKKLKEANEELGSISIEYGAKQKVLADRELKINSAIETLEKEIKEFKRVFIFENDIIDEVSSMGLRLEETSAEEYSGVIRGKFLQNHTHLKSIFKAKAISHTSKATITPPRFYKVDEQVKHLVVNALGPSREETIKFLQLQEIKPTVKRESSRVQAR